MEKVEPALDRNRILAAAEETIRRYGIGKATVLDVAKSLGVSHGSIYRHFTSKTELSNAVLEVWLRRIASDLESIVAEGGSGPDRLRRWANQLILATRTLAKEDPEMFEAYRNLAESSAPAVEGFFTQLVDQVSRIVTLGVERGELVSPKPHKTGTAICNALDKFCHPLHAKSWPRMDENREFEELWSLLMSGMRTKPKTELTDLRQLKEYFH